MNDEPIGTAHERNTEFRAAFSRGTVLQKALSNVRTILDIGAHRGESFRFFRGLFPEASILSVEPDPDSFRVLLENRGSNHECVNVALSKKCGEATLYRNDISHLNSLFRVNSESQDSIAMTLARGNHLADLLRTFNRPAIVSALTLDELVRRQRISSVDLLKIDVQGAETLILEGGFQTLLRTSAVLLEISLYDFYEKRKPTSFHEVESHLLPMGFNLFGFTDVSYNPMNGRTDWVEALYLAPRVVR